MKKSICLMAILTAMALASCAGAAASEPSPSAPNVPQQDVSTVDSLNNAGSVQSEVGLDVEGYGELKPIPGCRSTLYYPLKMLGTSTAVDFTRWTAQDLDGGEVTQDVLKDSKLTLVTAWSSGCSSCVADLTALQEVYESYPRDVLNVIGIASNVKDADGKINEGQVEISRQIVEMTGAQFTQILPSDDLIQIKLKDVENYPVSFLLDSGGNVVSEDVVGEQSPEAFKALVDGALESIS